MLVDRIGAGFEPEPGIDSYRWVPEERSGLEASGQFDLVSALIGLDERSLDEDAEIDLFQHLVSTGLAWKLQGRIGRQAAAMVVAGLIESP